MKNENKPIKTEQDAIEWVKYNIPIAIKAKRKANIPLVFPFNSQNAYEIICDRLGKELFKLLHQENE